MFRLRSFSSSQQLYNHIMTIVTQTFSCVFRIDVSFRMPYMRSQRLALLDTQTPLSKHSCVLTDTNFNIIFNNI